MPAVKDLEIGLFFWAEPDARATLANVHKTGVTSGQLAIDGTVKLGAETTAAWKAALAEADFHLFTVFAAYEGEDYADIPTVERTVGFIPKATRAAREVRTREVIELGAGLGVKSFGCHVGYIPHDASHPDYIDVRDMVRRIADYAATFGMTYCLETGQEPAAQLLEFFKDVDRSNVKINFDPANMILYGSGEPIEAFKLLRPHVISVHGKDGDWPDAGQARFARHRASARRRLGQHPEVLCRAQGNRLHRPDLHRVRRSRRSPTLGSAQEGRRTAQVDPRLKRLQPRRATT
jgi:L-ribulose-5-phosphate 3-epimerase